MNRNANAEKVTGGEVAAAGAVQQTLATAFERSGVGLHSGQPVRVRVCPAPPNAGRYWVRTDLPEAMPIAATIDRVTQTQLSTELGQGAARVRTVEHLLAALSSLGVDNARIEVDGPEVPLLEGSALGWVEAIQSAQVAPQPAPRRTRLPLSTSIHVQARDSFVSAFPARQPRFTCGIDFDLPAIGNQWHSWSPADGPEQFATEIAPARTFGLADQIEQLRQQGLIRGGSLDNALVCGPQGWLNPPLRFANEPARHKLLDLVGDMSLLGTFPSVHVIAYKASHTLHVQLAQQLAQACPDLKPSGDFRDSEKTFLETSGKAV